MMPPGTPGRQYLLYRHCCLGAFHQGRTAAFRGDEQYHSPPPPRHTCRRPACTLIPRHHCHGRASGPLAPTCVAQVPSQAGAAQLPEAGALPGEEPAASGARPRCAVFGLLQLLPAPACRWAASIQSGSAASGACPLVSSKHSKSDNSVLTPAACCSLFAPLVSRHARCGRQPQAKGPGGWGAPSVLASCDCDAVCTL